MIPITELRIGNYVLINNVVRRIAMISSFKDIVHIPSIGYYVGEDIKYIACEEKQLQPVAITNNLLERCGFVFDPYFKLWQKSKEVPGTGMEMELDKEYSVVDFLRRPLLKEMKNMHSLQNIFYALKGKDLNITSVKAVVF